MNISIIHDRKSKKGVRLRPDSVRRSDRRVLIDLGSARLLLSRDTAVDLTIQLNDLLTTHKKHA